MTIFDKRNLVMTTTTYDEIIEQGILYNFVSYDTPRLATYFHPGEEYDIKK